MKKTLAVLMTMTLLGVVAEELSLVDARAKISEVIADSAQMTSVIQQLSADDQRSFLADVNEAIGKMPGSPESRAVAYLNVNKAALRGVKKGNLVGLLAEVFATVSPEALTIINESFASDLFNRAANPSSPVSDEQFERLATETLKKIVERNASADNAAPRDAFAVLMFVRASNGSPTDLTAKLNSLLPADSQEIAKTEWLPPALADEKSYEALLGACDSGRQPDPLVVLRMAEPQRLEAMLTQLGAGGVDAESTASAVPESIRLDPDRGGIVGSDLDNGLFRVPFTYNVKAIREGAGSKHPGSRVIGDGPKVFVDDNGNIRTIPGGVPVDPAGKPVGPGGREIPMGYDGQD